MGESAGMGREAAAFAAAFPRRKAAGAAALDVAARAGREHVWGRWRVRRRRGAAPRGERASGDARQELCRARAVLALRSLDSLVYVLLAYWEKRERQARFR